MMVTAKIFKPFIDFLRTQRPLPPNVIIGKLFCPLNLVQKLFLLERFTNYIPTILELLRACPSGCSSKTLYEPCPYMCVCVCVCLCVCVRVCTCIRVYVYARACVWVCKQKMNKTDWITPFNTQNETYYVSQKAKNEKTQTFAPLN